MPRVCTRGRARGPAAVPGASSARERFEHVIRQPIVNENEPIENIVADPVRAVDGYERVAHPRIPLPVDIYGPSRRNSSGLHLADGAVLRELADRMQHVSRRPWIAGPLVGGRELDGQPEPLRNPANLAES